MYLFAHLLLSTLALGGGSSAASCPAPNTPYTVSLPGRPFASAELPSGQAAFVSVNPEKPNQQSGIAVLLCRKGSFQFSYLLPLSDGPTGIALTPDGSTLLVADDAYVAFVKTAGLLAHKATIDGYLKLHAGDIEDDSASASFVSVSPDGRYAFVSDEATASLTVVKLYGVHTPASAPGSIVGDIDVGNAPIASAFSPDASTLYLTSEVALRKYGFPITCREEGAPPDARPARPPGAVIAIDVRKAETDPAHAVLGFAPTACSAVRLSLSPSDGRLWVTNRGSDVAIALDPKAIVGSKPATLASVPVGSNPVPVIVTSDGRYVLVGNTNRFGSGGTRSGSITVIDTSTIGVAGTLRSGLFPRQFDRGIGTTVFLSNNRSDSVTIFDDRTIGRCLEDSASCYF